jgi:hypothetical protein
MSFGLVNNSCRTLSSKCGYILAKACYCHPILRRMREPLTGLAWMRFSENQGESISTAATASKASVDTTASDVPFYRLILLIILYIASPYYVAYSLESALKHGDQTQLENDIDFPSVWASLKEQLDSEISKASSGSFLATTASLLVHPVVHNTVDYYFTPSGIAALATNPSPQTAGESTYVSLIKRIIGTRLGLSGKSLKSQGFAFYNEFVLDAGEAKLHLHYYGLTWKLNRIELTPSFDLQAYMAN